jgi:hypothetical protein
VDSTPPVGNRVKCKKGIFLQLLEYPPFFKQILKRGGLEGQKYSGRPYCFIDLKKKALIFTIYSSLNRLGASAYLVFTFLINPPSIVKLSKNSVF